DVFKIFFAEGKKITALLSENFSEIRGINTVDQLAEAEAVLLKQ
ncbi:MAG: UDP-N-acetylglucosamine pyrophosphorylase, partial [Desulfobulbaceae bacterium]|nr:UDP-N-acetylglucosamine pyrophosphorylase [Desulfobulbaceae bacterium]